MGWLDRVEDRVVRGSDAERARPGKVVKAFSMPPFWATDGARIQLVTSALYPDREPGGELFEHYVANLYKANGIVFSCTVARARVFSQARFQYQRIRGGRPADLFGSPELAILERPWKRGTTGELCTHMEVDASLAGNFYATTADTQGRIGKAARTEDGRFVARIRPDWCTLILRAPSGNPFNVDVQVVGLSYAPPNMRNDPLILTADEFVHYSPLPDPAARFRGMSWLTPIVREVRADDAFTDHKTAFLKNGATPNLVVKMGEDIEEEEFLAFVQKFKDDYEGTANAYKTLFLAGGADVTPLTVDFKQLDLKLAQGALETRIASAAGVHPALAGLSEGLAGSSLNAGNFGATRRLFVDATVRDLWGKAAPSLEVLAPPPGPDTRLWYDDRDIPFLREDTKDEADTFFVQAQSVRQLVEAGYKPDAAVKAAKARDISLLSGEHSGLYSVQLQSAGANAPANGSIVDMPALDAAGRSNGNGRQPQAV